MKPGKLLTVLFALVTLAGLIPALAATARAEDIEINDTYFPDQAFREYVRDIFRKNENDTLSQTECERVKDIRVGNRTNIISLEGIEFFPNLETLYCSNTGITSLDLSSNTSLTNLNCSNTDIASLNVSVCPNLSYLDCSGTGITSLDLSNNTSLELLDCSRSADLTSLDVSGCTNLSYLDCSGTDITSLDLSNNTNLTTLYCSSTGITSLDVSGCSALKELVDSGDLDDNGYTKTWFNNDVHALSVPSSATVWTEPATTYNLWIGGTQVTDRNMTNVLGQINAENNKPTVEFKLAEGEKTAKLILNGANITGADLPAKAAEAGFNGTAGIFSVISLTLELNGTNTVTGKEAGAGSSWGILTLESLTVTGGETDSLTVTGDKAYRDSIGIQVFYHLTISGGTVTAKGGSPSSDSGGVWADILTVDSGTLTAEGCPDRTNMQSIGIRFNHELTVNDGTVKAKAYENGIRDTSGYGRITVNDGTVEAEANKHAIVSEVLTVNGGTVTANGMRSGIGVNRVTISDGTVTAIGREGAFVVEPDLTNYKPAPLVTVNTAATEEGAQKWTEGALGGGESAYKYVKIAPATTYDVWIGGKQVTSSNMNDVLKDGTVKFTPATATETAKLTLTGAEITGTYGFHDDGAFDHRAAIYSEIDLTLALEGENKITLTGTGGGSPGKKYYGIKLGKTDGNRIVQNAREDGEGSLSISVNYGFGIDLERCALTVESGKLTVEVQSDGQGMKLRGGCLTVKGGFVQTKGPYSSQGILCEKNNDVSPAVHVEGGVLEMIGGGGPIFCVSPGSETWLTWSDNCSITEPTNGTFNGETISDENGNDVAFARIEARAVTEDIITVDRDEIDFGTVDWGYTDAPEETICIVNKIRRVTLEFDGVPEWIDLDASSQFESSPGTELKPEIRPKTGLDAGTYGGAFVVKTVSPAVGQVKISVKFVVNKVQASVKNAPEGLSPTYSGKAQALVTKGVADGGTMQYRAEVSDGEGNWTALGGWSETVPSATDAGSYRVYYRVEGDDNHKNCPENDEDFENGSGPVSVPIKKAEILDDDVTAPEQNDLTYNGTEQVLLTPGSVNGGMILYSSNTDGTPPSDGADWLPEPPSAKDAGDYAVAWKIVPDANHFSALWTPPRWLTIKPAELTVEGLKAVDRYYDGTTDVVLTGGTLNGVIGDDKVEAAMPVEGQAVDGGIGTWDVTFDDITLSGKDAHNYTVKQPEVTVIIKSLEKSFVKTEPAANDLTYSGKAQALVTSGTAAGGTMQYRAEASDGNGSWTSIRGWSTTIPSATDAGSYRVYYRVEGDDNHKNCPENDEDFENGSGPVSVTIKPASVTVKADDKEKTVGEDNPTFTARVEGLVNGESEDLIEYGFKELTADTVNTYDIEPTGRKEQGNYTVTFVSGILTVKEADKKALNDAIEDAEEFLEEIREKYPEIAEELEKAIEEAKETAGDENAPAGDVEEILKKVEKALEDAENKENFEESKDDAKTDADKLSQNGDSEEVKKLIDDAKDAIDALTYDDQKSPEDNQKEIDNILEQLEEDLGKQRKDDFVDAKDDAKTDADDLSQPGDSEEVQKLIDDAKDAIDALPYDDQKSPEDNQKEIEKILGDLEDALKEQRKDDFDDSKDDAKTDADGLSQNGDSEEVKKLIEDAKDAIDALPYDDQKSPEDNQKEIEKILGDLEDALKEQRKDDFKDAKEDAKTDADKLSQNGDSEEVIKLIDDAKDAIDALTYDDQKSPEDNQKEIDNILKQLEEDLGKQRKDDFDDSKDDAKIDADSLSQNGDSEEVQKLIDDAKDAIDALTYDDQKSPEDNQKEIENILKQLEEDLGEQREKDFKDYKDEALDILNDLFMPYNSEESRKLIDDAKDAIEKLPYRKDKTPEENQAAIDEILEQLERDLKAQRDKEVNQRSREDIPSLTDSIRRAMEENRRRQERQERQKQNDVPPLPQEDGLPFLDVFRTDWFYDDVVFVYKNKIMNGVSDTRFDPSGTLTRGMIVTILWRMEGEPAVPYTGAFMDVPAGTWYTDGVEWAASHGIVLGYGDGTFGPEKPVTREQLAAILYRYAQFGGIDVSVGENTNILSYDDAFDISGWAFPAMQWACGTDVLDSGATAEIRPGEPASRAEIARAIRRFTENAAK